MKHKRTMIALIAIGGVVVLGAVAAYAGPIVYRDLIAGPPAESPTLTADDSAFGEEAGGEIDPALLNGTWLVGEGSFAGYRVDEVLNGTEVTVTGRTSEVTGTLTVNDLTLEAAEFTVDVASIATNSSHRDQYFRDSAMSVRSHPTAGFALTEPVAFDVVPAAGEIVEREVTGDLTLAGVTGRVTFTVQLRGDGSSVEIVGQIPIVFADYGVTAPQLGFVAVEGTGYVEFDLVAQRG